MFSNFLGKWTIRLRDKPYLYYVIIGIMLLLFRSTNVISLMLLSLCILQQGIAVGVVMSLFMALCLQIVNVFFGVGVYEYVISNSLIFTVFCCSSILYKSMCWNVFLEYMVIFFIGLMFIVEILFGNMISSYLFNKIPLILNEYANVLQTAFENLPDKPGNQQEQSVFLQNILVVINSSFFNIANNPVPYITAFLMFNTSLAMIFASMLQYKHITGSSLKQEFANVKISNVMLLLLIVGLLGSYLQIRVLSYLLLAAIIPFIFAGLSIVHHLLSKLKYAKVLFCIFYVLLLIALPLMSGVLIMLSLLDKKKQFRTT